MPTALLVPDTALLVPGASGRSRELAAVRDAALAAARRLVAVRPGRVLVVGPAARTRTCEAAQLCSSLAPLGIPERHLGWPAPCVLDGCPGHVDPGEAAVQAAPATAVGLRLLAAAGWTGPSTCVELAPSPSSGGGQAPVPVPTADRVPLPSAEAVLVLGSLSARRAEDSPRAVDPRALVFDEALVADLLDPTGHALARLRDLDTGLAEQLDVSGAEPWRALAHLVGTREVEASEQSAELALGMDYRVITWRWEA